MNNPSKGRITDAEMIKATLALRDCVKYGNIWAAPSDIPIYKITPPPLTAKVEKPPEPQFEVNMMEVLVGWKLWCINNGKLYSASQSSFEWIPGQPAMALCRHELAHNDIPINHIDPDHIPPVDGCSCGIYAADGRDIAQSYDDYDGDGITGLVCGWGRYVRGSEGWRAQLAYPKFFLLRTHQLGAIEHLKAFHVPIFIEQPTLIYNPEEDGYEYRKDEADRDCGTFAESTSSEARDTDEDY